jgi:hypothetical protein
MAYSDLLRAVTADFNVAANLIDGQLSSFQTKAISGGGVTTTSTSFVRLEDSDMAFTIATGQSILLLAQTNLIISAAPQFVTVQWHEDGTAIGSPLQIASTVYTGAPLIFMKTPTAGAHTYDVKWKVSGGTGTDNGGQVIGLVLQTS